MEMIISALEKFAVIIKGVSKYVTLRPDSFVFTLSTWKRAI